MAETLFLTGGRIHSSVASTDQVESLAIQDGLILACGSASQVRSSFNGPYREIDLQGLPIFPSFTEGLGSIGREALARIRIDLSLEQNITEIFAIVERYAKAQPRGDWIIGYGWNKGRWGWQRFPHRADLDLVAPHHPVALFSGDHRVVWLNSAAVSEIGIHHDTPDPEGGEIERDLTTGSATGILKETAVRLVEDHLEAPTPEEMKEGIRSVFNLYARMGVTLIHSFDSLAETRILMEMDSEKDLPTPVIAYAPAHERRDAVEEKWISNTNSSNVQFGGFWFCVDGTLISQTARLLEPYGADWDQLGVEVTPTEKIKELVSWCYQNGYVPNLYSVGDAACRTALSAFEDLEGQRGKMVPYLVHGDLVQTQDLEKIRRLDLHLRTNPRRIVSENEAGRVYLGDRWRRVLNLRGWHENGAQLLFGSGEPLSQWSPLKAMEAATLLLEDRDPGAVLSNRAALEALVRSPAEKGGGKLETRSLVPGSSADLVVLSEDPLETPAHQIGKIEVLATLHKGRVLYQGEGDLFG